MQYWVIIRQLCETVLWPADWNGQKFWAPLVDQLRAPISYTLFKNMARAPRKLPKNRRTRENLPLPPFGGRYCTLYTLHAEKYENVSITPLNFFLIFPNVKVFCYSEKESALVGNIFIPKMFVRIFDRKVLVYYPRFALQMNFQGSIRNCQ